MIIKQTDVWIMSDWCPFAWKTRDNQCSAVHEWTERLDQRSIARGRVNTLPTSNLGITKNINVITSMWHSLKATSNLRDRSSKRIKPNGYSAKSDGTRKKGNAKGCIGQV